MGWKKFVLMIACVLIGSFLTDGFTNKLGATVLAIGFGMGCYYDGKKAGAREVFTNEK